MRRIAWTGRATFRLICFIVLIGIIGWLAAGCRDENPPAPDPLPVPSENRTPIAYAPFSVSSFLIDGQRIDYDLRYLEHGCANGTAQMVTGAWDPDGDALEYLVECSYAVYAVIQSQSDPSGSLRKINNQWVTFPRDDNGVQHAVVTLFVGWDAASPPYPFAPKAITPECVPSGGCGGDPIPSVVYFSYTVRDTHGATARAQVRIGD